MAKESQATRLAQVHSDLKQFQPKFSSSLSYNRARSLSYCTLVSRVKETGFTFFLSLLYLDYIYQRVELGDFGVEQF